jgi:predicted secreted Zn-dependent protease
VAKRAERQPSLAASRPQGEREDQESVAAVDPRRSLLALLARHDSARPLRTRAVRELNRQHGNQFVQRSLAPLADGVQVRASATQIAREEGEEESAVKVNATPTNSKYTVTGTTLAQAFASIQTYANSHNGEAGSVKWAPKWKLTPDSDGYVSGVTVTANIVKTMPSWAGAAKLSAAAKAEWDRVYKELDDHENRHLEILTNGATYIGNSALGSKLKDGEKAANDAKNSINADNVGIDPFETVMTTDIE